MVGGLQCSTVEYTLADGHDDYDDDDNDDNGDDNPSYKQWVLQLIR